MKRIARALFAAVLAAVSSLPSFAATPKVGEQAPPLTFTELLQAPAGTNADWPALRGKVVVLEFWATWCSGCIEEIPHLNAMVHSLAAANVQFIAVDDEDSALVKKFLGRTPMDGWLGLDTTGKTIKAYDVQFRPRTFVIDKQGRIAAILSPHQLEGAQLLALAADKPVAFPTVDDTAEVRDKALKEAKAAIDAAAAGSNWPKPLFDISIRPGDPAGRITIAHRPGKNDDSYTYDFMNAPVQVLMQFAGGVSGARMTVHGDNGAKYSLHLGAPGGDFEQLAPALQMAIAAATGMKLSHVTAMEDVYILQATPKAASLLSPVTSEQGSMCFFNAKAGKLVMMQTSMDGLAKTLETTLMQPVVNETGLAGQFDANFDLPKGDADSVQAALEKNLGLTLIKAKRSINRIVLDAPPAAAEKPAPGGLEATPKK